jgi:uncharacterized protein YkuJ
MTWLNTKQYLAGKGENKKVYNFNTQGPLAVSVQFIPVFWTFAMTFVHTMK